MADPRIEKLAKVLVHYSLGLKAGQQIQIRTHPIAEDLTQAVYEEVIKVGAYPFMQVTMPGLDEIFFKYASDAQLDYVSPVRKLITETFDAVLNLWTEHNTHALSGIDPSRMARVSKAGAPLIKLFMERAAPRRAALVPDGLPLAGDGAGCRHGPAGLPRVRLRGGDAQRARPGGVLEGGRRSASRSWWTG